MTITSTTIALPTNDGTMPTYQAMPVGPVKGGVIVFQEAFGVTTHIEDVARRFADAGWHALAPSLFHRAGSPVIPYDDLATAMPLMGTLTPEGLAADLRAAIDQLGSAGHVPARTAVVGFCMGGTVSFYAATLQPLGAAVSFYGGGVVEGRFGLSPLIELAPTLQAPWLGLYGEKDHSIPVNQIEQLEGAVVKAQVETKLVRYPEGQHGFHCNDRPAVFDAAAAADAWARTLAWLDRHVAS